MSVTSSEPPVFAERRSTTPALFVGGAGSAAALAWLASSDFVNPNPLFHPHGYCYLWQPSLVAAHVVSDALIALSYLTISLTLVYLVRRAHRAIPYQWMFLAFGMFIVACGMTHAMEIVTLWRPWFWLSADVKIITAVASVSTAIALPPLVPKILHMVAAAGVSEERRVALERSNAALEQHVEERTHQLSEAIAREHELRERAEEANRLKDEFLSTVSHELRTPLTAILGWGEMLVNHQLSADAVERAIGSIQRSARAQAQLVDDLLDVSRMVSGKLRLDRRPVSFDQVVHDAVDSITPVATARKIAVVPAGDPWPPMFVVGDSHRLQQVVWNLLSNAVKFTPDGGQITVSLTQHLKMVRLEITDTGIGLEPKLLGHIFERFRQAETAPHRLRQGLGLGLALARDLTELHGGRIEAHSEGLGRGSTFIVELPTSAVPVEAARLDPAMVSRLDGVRILLVDDDAQSLEVVTAALTSAGATVIPTSAAAEAMACMGQDRVDLIISDIAMPDMDGYQFIRRIRDDLHSMVPAIALTARVRREDRAMALASGFQLHISKPVVPGDLVMAALQLLGERLAS